MSLGVRVATQLKDAVRYSRVTRELAGWAHWAKGRFKSGAQSRVTEWVRALELAESDALEGAASRSLQGPGLNNTEFWRDVVLSLPRYRDLVRRDPGLSRSMVLKAPGENGEKGIFLITFEYNWARLLTGLSEEQFRWFDDRFDLVLSTSWSPTHYAVLALALSRIAGPIFVQSCDYKDIPRMERFHPRIHCLPTLPCDWINPQLYQPKPFAERTTDIVMVANWGAFKRHWDLFQALAKLPPDLKVVLIGQPEPGRTQDLIRRQIREFGARQDLQIYESIPIQEVAAHQSNAKVSVIMTRREGCCVAAVESLFAGCALAMREDAHVGAAAYINEHTGALLRPGHIAEDLAALLERTKDLRPHEWAQQNLSCQVSHQKVNAVLRAQTEKAGRPWTRDIAQPQWRPHPTFVQETEKNALKPVYEELHHLNPLVFPANLWSDSWK